MDGPAYAVVLTRLGRSRSIFWNAKVIGSTIISW